MTSDRDIFDALDLTHSRSLLRFDGNAARERIEDLPWIKTAAITRIFPDSINIEVTEREPMAVWHNAGRDMLIDATGRVLGAAPPSMQTGLPRVLGEEAAGAAAALLTTLDRYSSVRDRVREAVFVAKRRWTLQLKDGPALLLPADRMAEALDLVAAKLAPVRLLDDSRYAAIDLRSPDRIILTPRPEEEQKTASGHQLQPSG
jgi:cell division protein FtsQ